MAAEAPFLAGLATAGAALITHVGLLDEDGVELSGGGYARQAVTASAAGAQIRLDTDETFQVPAGTTVAGWSGFSAATGGTRYGGRALPPETYTGAGSYILTGASTGYTVQAVPDA